MTRRLLLTYLTITALTLVIVVVPLGLTFASRERDRLIFYVERDAQAIGSRAEDDLENDREPDLTDVFDQYTADGARIVVVDAAGRTVADSDRADIGRDYSTRPEIARALNGERVTGRRHSDTLRSDLVYVAIPVASDGQVHGAVRITLPTSTVDERVRDTWMRLAALSAIVLSIVGAVGLILARGVTRPVRQLQGAAERLAAGDLSARAGEVEGAPELASLAHQFDATAERLELLVDAQRRFVSDASQQLRTPLTALRLRLETLRPSPDDEVAVDAALAETDRLARLVQSLLELARADGARPALTDVDATAVAAERCATWADVAEAAGIELVLDAPHPCPARTVEGGLEQILDNLVSNALAVADAGTTVTVSVRAEGHGAAVRVLDEGPGMPAAHRAQATSRFWRPPGATGPGSGLGLAIVDHLAMAAGGELELSEGPEGQGLLATVHLPAPGSVP
ncbi:MAG: HAMP domain-containing protein [Acidimicrobiales bacterium]|nr:HAMP domain-containing protein [Acidimicrobiales bacterium]HRW37931.1 ATP-binding protein [Aquihabitans sp.]